MCRRAIVYKAKMGTSRRNAGTDSGLASTTAGLEAAAAAAAISTTTAGGHYKGQYNKRQCAGQGQGDGVHGVPLGTPRPA